MGMSGRGGGLGGGVGSLYIELTLIDKKDKDEISNWLKLILNINL